MTEILAFASIIAPLVTALVELVKKTVSTPVNLLPVIALVIGLIVGGLSYPISDLDLTIRLWSGALAGLAGTGLFELIKQRDGNSKEEE
jgi:hypothetical protein